jgi:hydrogenase maturation protease
MNEESFQIRRETDPNAASPSKPILVLGIGNILLSDEGVGVRVIEGLGSVLLPSNVEICDGGTSGADLLDIIASREKIIVIDSMDSGLEPGRVRILFLDDFSAVREPSISLHDIGILETYKMTKLLGCEPKKVLVIGVQPGNLSVGADLSPQVAASIPGIIDFIRKEIEADGATLPNVNTGP